MLLTASLLFLSEVIRLLYAEKEMALLGQTGSTSLPNKIVRVFTKCMYSKGELR